MKYRSRPWHTRLNTHLLETYKTEKIDIYVPPAESWCAHDCVTMRGVFGILCSTELFFCVTASHGIWSHHDGPHLSGKEPEQSSDSKSQSSEDSWWDMSACGGGDHCRAVSDRKILPDEPPGRTEPWWVLTSVVQDHLLGSSHNTGCWSSSPPIAWKRSLTPPTGERSWLAPPNL